MTFNFAKTLMMGSVITMGAFGLIACGDDSSSGAPADEQPGSSASADATQDISISATNLGSRTRGIGVNAEVIFSGNFDIDLSAQQTGEATDISFTAISYDVAYGTVVPGESYRSLGDLTAHQEVRFPTKMIDLGSANSAGVSISLAIPLLTRSAAALTPWSSRFPLSIPKATTRFPTSSSPSTVLNLSAKPANRNLLLLKP